MIRRSDEPTLPERGEGPGYWAVDARYSLPQKLTRWAVWTMMHQRHITWPELREELGGISNARLGQIFKDAGDVAMFRLEDAIQAITERRHAAMCTCGDISGCAVFSACLPNAEDGQLLRAKKGAMEQWRERYSVEGLIPTR